MATCNDDSIVVVDTTSHTTSYSGTAASMEEEDQISVVSHTTSSGGTGAPVEEEDQIHVVSHTTSFGGTGAPMEEEDQIPVVNILLLGKVGVGKARIVNEMFRKVIFESKAVTGVVGGVSQREKEFLESGTLYRIKIFDTCGISSRRPGIKINKTMDDLKEYVTGLYPNGLNLILLVYRHQDWTQTEKKRFLYLLRRLNEERTPLITALVITGCANKNDSARKKIISEFDTNSEMQVIGRYVLRGIFVVGFTDISTVPDAMADMYSSMNYRDALPLKEMMERCCMQQQVVDDFFYQGHCYKGFLACPWHLCPCYSRIYTLLRWGYNWDECIYTDTDTS